MQATIVEIYPSRSKGVVGFRWRAKARNGEIIAQGESYTRRHDAKRGAFRVLGGQRRGKRLAAAVTVRQVY